jgi:hypothetical protein
MKTVARRRAAKSSHFVHCEGAIALTPKCVAVGRVSSNFTLRNSRRRGLEEGEQRLGGANVCRQALLSCSQSATGFRAASGQPAGVPLDGTGLDSRDHFRAALESASRAGIIGYIVMV